MSKKLFVTGTGTDVGKTYISALLLKKMNEYKLNCAYFKAAMSGNARDKDGNLVPGDAEFVKKISGIEQPVSKMCPYVYENAFSPHLASRLEGNPVDFKVVSEWFDKTCSDYDFVLMEGSGGITCPIDFDKKELYLDEIVKSLGLSSVIVADAGLGTINYVLLTVNYMKSKNLKINGLIFNHYHPGNVMEEDNIFMCEHLTGIKTVAKVKDGDDSIEITKEKLISLFE